MTVTLTPETATRLREQAQQSGQDVDSFADTLLADALTQNAPEVDPDDLTDADVAEIRAGIGRGLEAASAGRVKSLPKPSLRRGTVTNFRLFGRVLLCHPLVE